MLRPLPRFSASWEGFSFLCYHAAIAVTLSKPYDALRDAGAAEEKAREAAEEVAGYENRLANIESGLQLIKWMLGFNLAFSLASVVKTFFTRSPFDPVYASVQTTRPTLRPLRTGKTWCGCVIRDGQQSSQPSGTRSSLKFWRGNHNAPPAQAARKRIEQEK